MFFFFPAIKDRQCFALEGFKDGILDMSSFQNCDHTISDNFFLVLSTVDMKMLPSGKLT